MKSHISGIQIPTASRINIDGGLTLDAQAGNSGEMMISQGTGNTPIWSNTLTSPTINTSIVAGSASFNLLTTVATTINFGSAATTMNIATGNLVKTINLGTGGSGGNQVDVNIGASASATTSNINLYGQTLLGKPVTSATTASGFGATLTTQGTTGTGTTGNATGATLQIYSGSASLTNASNTAGTATSGNLILDVGSATVAYFDGIAAYGNIQIGVSNASSVTIGKATGTTTIGGPLVLSGTVGGHTLTGSLVGATTTTSLAPIRLPSGTVPSSANQQFGMLAAGAESLQLSTTKTTGAGPGFGIITAPHTVFSLANSTASINTNQSVFAAGNDTLSSLEPAKLYRFKGQYYSSFTFSTNSGAIRMLFDFSNAPQSIKYSTLTTATAAGGSPVVYGGVRSFTSAATITPAMAASTEHVTNFEGYFVTHASLSSTFTPQFICTAPSLSSAVMQAGSWIEVQKVGTSSQTLIAGNWA